MLQSVQNVRHQAINSDKIVMRCVVYTYTYGWCVACLTMMNIQLNRSDRTGSIVEMYKHMLDWVGLGIIIIIKIIMIIIIIVWLLLPAFSCVYLLLFVCALLFITRKHVHDIAIHQKTSYRSMDSSSRGGTHEAHTHRTCTTYKSSSRTQISNRYIWLWVASLWLGTMSSWLWAKKQTVTNVLPAASKRCGIPCHFTVHSYIYFILYTQTDCV